MVVDTVWSFDPVKRSWFSEGSLRARRKNFGLVVSKQTMFAIGGQDKHGRYLFIIFFNLNVTGSNKKSFGTISAVAMHFIISVAALLLPLKDIIR